MTAPSDRPADTDTTPNPAADSAATAIKPFSFPFAADVFAPTARNDKPWHQLANKSSHDKRPGAAPKGTRRSMGKR